MEENTEFGVLEWIRRVRDDQGALLQGKSNAEIIAFFTEAGGTARRDTESRSKETLSLDSEEEPND